MNKNILIFIFVLILLAVPVLAEDTLYKTNEVAILKATCLNNNTFCSDTATCNITVLTIKDDVVVDNKVMDRNSTQFEYSLTRDITQNAGIYKKLVTCNDGDFLGYAESKFEINSFGEEFSFSKMFFVPIMIIFCWCLLIISWKLEDYNLVTITGFFMMLLGVEVFINGISGYFQYETIIRTLGLVHMFGGFYLVFKSTYARPEMGGGKEYD